MTHLRARIALASALCATALTSVSARGACDLDPSTSLRSSDTCFVRDLGASADAVASHQLRSAGDRIEIEIPITRYVGPVDSSGRLLDAPGLVAAGVVGANATLGYDFYWSPIATVPSEETPPICDQGVYFPYWEYAYCCTGNVSWCCYDDNGLLNIPCAISCGTVGPDPNGCPCRNVNPPDCGDPPAPVPDPACEDDSFDQLYLNGEPIGFVDRLLQPEGGHFRLVQSVPIGSLRFPELADPGKAPTPRINVLAIEPDGSNSGYPEGRCYETAADGGAVGIRTASPVVLVHGNGSDSGFWLRHGFAPVLIDAKLNVEGCSAPTCRRPIDLKTRPLEVNAETLETDISQILRMYGADSFHIVAHSKGGLDSRGMLPALSSTLQLVSMTTLGTPHDGSLLADLIQARRGEIVRASSFAYRGFPSFAPLLVELTPTDLGKPSLTTFSARDFARNVFTLPDADYYQVAGDADRNGTGTIDLATEIQALRVDAPKLDRLASVSPSLAIRSVDLVYRVLRNVASVSVDLVRDTTPGGKGALVAVISATAGPARPNDTLVTVASALGSGSISARSAGSSTYDGAAGRNHSNVADAGVAARVRDWILESERRRGDLR